LVGILCRRGGDLPLSAEAERVSLMISINKSAPANVWGAENLTFAREEHGMRRFVVGLIVVVMVMAGLAGCGDSEGGAAAGLPTSSTTAQTAGETTPPTEPPADGSGGSEAWTTVAELRSTDPFFQDMEGLLISEAFTVTGDVRVVLDMPEAGHIDGVIVAVVPEEAAADVFTLLRAMEDATVLTLIPSAPVKEVPGLDGTYVLVNSLPAAKDWTLEVQTRN